ncbi:MAG: NifB/NifX family molybdenum-iron cluster-binding protein [Archaeoglobi archaeon]|nr:NifB/NifX family molybdenum-iron cluster-binding protein [Candidatus Mnemosynella sp.]
MKVAVPTMGTRGLEEEISQHFGRAPTFTIVDLESNEVEIIPNMSEHMGGTGKPPEHLAKLGVSAVIVSGIGPRAIEMFRSFGIEVYSGASGRVKDAIELFKRGLLQRASLESACREHRH